MSKLGILLLTDTNISNNILNFFQDVESIKIINNVYKYIDKYDYILVINGDEENLSRLCCSLEFHQGKDSVHGDIGSTNSNEFNILNCMIDNPDFKAINSLGYIKSVVNKIEPNFHTRNGGIWVRKDTLSKIYITRKALQKVNTKQYNDFNIIE